MAERAFSASPDLSHSAETVKEVFVIAGEAAIDLGDSARLNELLTGVEALPPGRTTRFYVAHTSRFRARLAGSDDSIAADRGFGEAIGLFRETGMPFYLAVVLLEHAELLVKAGRTAESEPLLAEARETFERLGTAPWLERLDALAVGGATVA